MLLSVWAEEDQRHLLSFLPQTVPALNFILTSVSLALITSTNKQKDVFSLPPLTLLTEAMKDDSGSEMRRCLAEYLELAADHNQAGVLSQLSGDVDVARFSSDHQYKEDTILGLARFLEADNWEFTCSLANRYNLQSWLVAATHLEVSHKPFQELSNYLGTLE